MDLHASGTCRKNARLGFAYRQQLLHERVAWEFGYAFDTCPTSRITTGIPMTEGDCKPVTEAGWHIDRLLSLATSSQRMSTRLPTSRSVGLMVIVKASGWLWRPHPHISSLLGIRCMPSLRSMTPLRRYGFRRCRYDPCLNQPRYHVSASSD